MQRIRIWFPFRIASLCMASFFCSIANAQLSHDITFEHEGKTVYGTLMLPDGIETPPVIIVTPGSGPNDRDATLQLVGGNSACLYPDLTGNTLKPYLQLAEALVDSGYAVLRYDKLEFTYGSNLGTISFRKLWLPVESAIDFLRSRDDVDTSQIILAGHSEGAALIPYIARTKKPVRALISLAGARTPFDSLLAYQLVHFTQLCGGNIVVAQNQANQILGYFDLLRTDTWNAGTPSFAGVPASVWDRYVEVTDSVAINYNLGTAPVLFLGMGEDVNVPPAELERFQTEITSTEDFWSLPGLNHYMTPNDDPNVSMHLSDTIVYWLHQQGITTSNPHDLSIQQVLVVPNPVRGSLSIELGKHFKAIQGEIIDSLGRVISHFGNSDIDQLEIDVTAFPPGTYQVRIQADARLLIAEFVKR